VRFALSLIFEGKNHLCNYIIKTNCFIRISLGSRSQPRTLLATPRLFSLYQTAVNYYETMTEHYHALETPDIRVNTLSDRRNVMLTFIRTNKYKVGLNLLSNYLRAISKCIPKNCILQTKNQFKTFCKINLIQKGLFLL